MCKAFWQAKIWGLLHEPALKALYPNLGGEGGWERLHCMQGWQSPNDPATHPNSNYSSTWLEDVGLCDLIALASDRATIGRLPAEHSGIFYGSQGLQLHHLLSGEPQTLILNKRHQDITGAEITSDDRTKFLDGVEEAALNKILECEEPQQVFWWLWRCYTEALSTSLGDEPCIHLLPAETRLPDASLWSHATMTSALAGALAGYYDQPEDYLKENAPSRPYVATFSFTPVQELIKASRKMRDFWAGSWLLHYLSAKVCWAIAQKYGPDTLLYPCLYSQPLIDHWLLKKYDFNEWITQPSDQQLLTAGFPNVLVMILPNNGKNPDDIGGNPVRAAMAYAEAVLKQEWNNLGKEVLAFLQSDNREGGEQWRDINPQTWEGWLKTQWQTYWVALPIGESSAELHHSPRKEKEYQEWIGKQNDFANPNPALFVEPEYKFLEAIFKQTAPKEEDNPSESATKEEFKARQSNINVGSWWASIFDQVRFNLNSVKNARTWQLPTAFGPRSTVSGLGSVVHPIYDSAKPEWATEGETEKFWSKDMGLFDGIEELNATEVLKRGLHQVLLPALSLNPTGKIPVLYPDLSSGVAGWLRQMEAQNNVEAINYFQLACQEIIEKFPWTNEREDAPAHLPWGIPWVAKNHGDWLNPRLLNAGWLIDDFHPKNPNPAQPLTLKEQKKAKQDELRRLREQISKRFKLGNNPTDWYVLAAGDGDGMSEWLKGEKLNPYSDYIPDALDKKIKQMPEHLREPFQAFLKVRKRMGPATHSALSRALLDFSNQLVPYLTEERYAGRLIYAGGDDVLAYTNLWEWDQWLWDIRQCFRGDEDEKKEFDNQGDYWRWKGKDIPEIISPRPLFTMGNTATISFGVVIANHSVPLAIALENLWEAEEEAKEHFYISSKGKKEKKDAVQVRVLYGTGNVLKSTAKFNVFQCWKKLLEAIPDLDAALFEQAATVWSQHPAPVLDAIAPWTQAFCNRRDVFKGDDNKKANFRKALEEFLCELWKTTPEKDGEREIQNWLKLAALIIRKREIKLGGES